MKNNPLLEQSLTFATKIIKLQNILLKEKKESIISKQIIRSATNTGANINEVNYASSKHDIISKLHFPIILIYNFFKTIFLSNIWIFFMVHFR